MTGWTCASPQLMTIDDVEEYRILVGWTNFKEAK